MNFRTLTIAAALLVSATGANAAGDLVTIKGFAYDPPVLTVKVGDSVTFVNEDSAPHTATATNGAFDTGNLRRNAQSTLTFTTAGVYDYFCVIHPNMRAQLVVE